MKSIYDLDLNLLKSLQALLQHRHVGRAAEDLGVTQPAMSHALRRLRDTFGDPILVRSGNRMIMTARAKELRPHLDQIFNEVLAMTAKQAFDPHAVKSVFRIATHDFIATQHLSHAFPIIAQTAPGLSFQIEAFASDSYTQLEDGKVDLIVSAGLQARPQFIQKMIAEDPLVCLLDRSHQALSNWTPETIFQHPHMALGLLGKRDDPVEAFGRKAGMPSRKIGMTVGDLHMQPALLESSNMIAFVPRSLAQKAAKDYDLTTRDCAFDLPANKIFMIWGERHKDDLLHHWVRSVLGRRGKTIDS